MECGKCGYQSDNDALFCARCSHPLLDLTDSDRITADIVDVNLAILEKVLPEHLKIIKRLGSGGMATVYEAMDQDLDQRVALKVLPLDKSGDRESVNRFKREARMVATLKHPNIVPFYFMETVGQFHFFTMALMEGGNLMSRIGDGMPLPRAVNIIRQIAGALGHAHKKNIIHRDIKPDNVIFDHNDKPHLADFGIAKGATSTQLTATQVMLGTPAYISPEQIMAGEVGPPADLYALGAMFYHMITGRVMFPGDDLLSSIARHLNEIPPRPSEIKPGVEAADAIVMRLISKKPEDRPQTAEALIQELDGLFDKSGEPTPQPTIPPPIPMQAPTAHSQVTQNHVTQDTEVKRNTGVDPATAETTALPSMGAAVTTPQNPEGKKKGKGGYIAVAAVAGMLVLLLVLWSPWKREPDPNLGGEPVVQEPEATPQEPPVKSAEAEKERLRIELIQKELAKLEFVTVPAGPFKMGSRIKFMEDEKPVHDVEISRFSLSRTETPQSLWVAVMGDNPSCNKGDEFPVENVSWDQVQVFLNRLEQATGEAYRLPTEAEWEYACKAGKTGFIGAILQFRPHKEAWYQDNSDFKTRKSALKDANPFGLYDMLGNVWEWCSDYYSPTYYKDEPVKDPKGPETGEKRVIRGGAWNSLGKDVRPTNRHASDPASGDCAIGFRLAK